MTAIATAGELDPANQHTLVRPEDADFGLDTTALGHPPEAVRRVFDTDTDELTDRIDQAWITPYTDDDYYRLAC